MPTVLQPSGVTIPEVNDNIDRDKWGDILNASFGVYNNQYRFFRHGECRLIWNSGTGNLELQPLDGNIIVINSEPKTIPDAGVTLSAAGTVADTTYHIYAYMNAGTMTLEYSTTLSLVQAGTGVRIKSGDATRTLVGLARTTAASIWIDTSASRLVLSWFNRQPKFMQRQLTIGNVTTGTLYQEIWTGLRCDFITWGFDPVFCSATVPCGNNVVGAIVTYALTLNNPVVTIPGAINSYSVKVAGNPRECLSIPMTGLLPSFGNHYITLSAESTGGVNTTVGSVGFTSTSVKVQITG